jgi:nitrite reductase/ring-hydroxylating ferredoxin subunit
MQVLEVKRLSFVKVGETSEVPVGKMKMFKVGEKEYLVANVDGNYYAMGNRCTHQKGNLSQDSLDGNVVTCPRHKSRFDVTTGKNLSGPKIPLFHPKIDNEPVYEVKVEGTTLMLKPE